MIWVAALALLALAVLAYGLFEAGWLRTRVLEVEIEGLPESLDGLRIAHLSDFHLGVPSRGRVATERAVAWVAERRPDLVCITGDLVSHPRGVPLLVRLLRTLERPFVVLGNHDVAVTRDPFSRAAELDGLRRGGACCSATRRSSSSAAGGGSRSWASTAESYPRGTARPWELADPDADLRILLCHFPGIVRRLPAGAFHLVLAGHLHAGQIVLPYPGREGRRSRIRERGSSRASTARAGECCTSRRAPGTTFVPFRFFARPEVTELVLRPAAPACNNPPDGRALAHLDGHPRELRGRCGARDRRRARARRGDAAAAPRRQGDERRRRRRRRAPPRGRLGRQRPAVGERRAGEGGRVSRAHGRPRRRRRWT